MSKYANDIWKSGITSDKQKAITSFVSEEKAPLPTKWKVMKNESLAKMSARINENNLFGAEPKNRPSVKFLRSGKMWAVIVG